VKHFLLIYELAADYLDRRPAFRDAHLALAKAAAARGELVVGGALDPADRALLLFAGEDAGAAERFAQVDPYVANGLVTRWSVRGWATVVGELAATPL
jgi:uncharacterized protein YciI